jgi:hypothetical protein
MSAPYGTELRHGKPGEHVYWHEKNSRYYVPFSDQETEYPRREGRLVSWAGAQAWIELDSGEIIGVSVL